MQNKSYKTLIFTKILKHNQFLMCITIFADNREKVSGIPEMLSAKNINIVMKQLAAGDYIINDEIVIERKTNIDFVQSIIDNRLFGQCAKLRKTGMTPLIIVEGNPYKTRHNIKPEAIKGALLATIISWQIPVIRSSGKEDTVHLMITASKQNINSPGFIRRSGIKPKNRQRQQHYFIQSLPGIGPALAHRLLAHFSTIEKIVFADIKSLEKVEGIGKTKATNLFKFFRTGETENTEEFTERVNALSGSVTLPENFDYKTELEKAINEKHNA